MEEFNNSTQNIQDLIGEDDNHSFYESKISAKVRREAIREIKRRMKEIKAQGVDIKNDEEYQFLKKEYKMRTAKQPNSNQKTLDAIAKRKEKEAQKMAKAKAKQDKRSKKEADKKRRLLESEAQKERELDAKREAEEKLAKLEEESKAQKLKAEELKQIQDELAKDKEAQEQESIAEEEPITEPVYEENKEPIDVTKTQSSDGNPPELSLPDDITEDDINNAVQEFYEEDEDDEDYTGMTEQEIAEAKERKRKLREFQKKYGLAEKNSDVGEGAYKKNLDFSINTSIKRFKVKPPKKPFIIAAAVMFVIIAIGGVMAYFVLNKPPEPVVLSSIRLNQTKTTQYVGETVDLRGLIIECKYSNDTTKYVPVTEAMISATSSNIDQEHNIIDINSNTFVKFTYQGIEAKLDITVEELAITGLNILIVGKDKYNQAEPIYYDNILITASTNLGKTLKIAPTDVAFYEIYGEGTNETIKEVEYAVNNETTEKIGFYVQTNKMKVVLTFDNTEYSVEFTVVINEEPNE